ncbi:MAG TPA: MgtC/SapB family protein [Bacteroidales bacterium]|nr:MgtC/SapB family protein [Bacteroidales bacterium]HNR41068.1 MgtC/SapB family protein [Bacteroidales bacterium]
MISWTEILLRLLLASLFGALIGLERERKNWAAGLRTHMMVCVGSCLIMIVSAFGFADILGTPHVTLDPSRIAAQVITGIGFIGAGTILLSKEGIIHGLTTAAGLWTVAAIGLATGGGLYFAAGATTVIALIILWALQPFERIFSGRFRYNSLKIVTDSIDLLRNLLNNDVFKIESLSVEKGDDGMVLNLRIAKQDQKSIETIIRELENNPNVKEITLVK